MTPTPTTRTGQIPRFREASKCWYDKRLEKDINDRTT